MHLYIVMARVYPSQITYNILVSYIVYKFNRPNKKGYQCYFHSRDWDQI